VLYFKALPVANPRYYQKTLGDIDWFMLDSDCNEPDSNQAGGTQAQTWLKPLAQGSTKPWRVRAGVGCAPPHGPGTRGPRLAVWL
jgi:hypothetical protein